MALNFNAIIKIVSFVILLLGGAMILPTLISVLYKEYDVASAFLAILLCMLLIGIFITIRIKVKISKLKLREGFLAVALSWIFASLFGCLPYLFTGTIDGFANALFESVSGFTTTGATVILDVESLPSGILFWRSFCQWLGGMGILIFAISILPALGISGQYMAKAETPGIYLGKIVPRMSDTAKILYIIYSAFTLLSILLFKLGGLNLFDSVIASMGSVASGGLSNYNTGLSHFNSIYIESISSLFSILTCINFTVYYNAVKGNWKESLFNSELKVFLSILVAAGIMISFNLKAGKVFYSAFESIRHGFFQSASFITTTGYYSADFNLWPTFSRMVLLLLMIVGASSASTGGGIKVIRTIILFKLIRRGIFLRLHPQAVVPVKVQGKTLSSQMISGVVSFLSLYAVLFMLSLLVVSLENLDFLSTVSTVAATLNNVGTGMSLLGPGGSFALFSPFMKIYLSFLMLFGRLELFTILLLFSRAFWNPDR